MAASHSPTLQADTSGPAIDAKALPARYRNNGFGESLRDVWHQITGAVFDSYRPELHYMRGPGPACAAKRSTTFR